MKPKDRIIFALDVSTPSEAIGLVDSLWSHVGYFKIGLQFITAMLASIIAPDDSEAISNLKNIRELFKKLDGKVLWDGKFDDIPNTVGAASKEVVKIGAKMLNVHASCGIKAMTRAVGANEEGKTIVLAVTVLTSLGEDNVNLIFGGPSKARVLQFARDAKIAGCDGVICSSQELGILGRQAELDDMIRVTPGIRPNWAQIGDQNRAMTPSEAIKAGADYLVIGRPIRKPPEEIGTPVDAAKEIATEIKTALAEKGIDYG